MRFAVIQDAGSWNNGEAHYRCTFLNEYAAKDKANHPTSVR